MWIYTTEKETVNIADAFRVVVRLEADRTNQDSEPVSAPPRWTGVSVEARWRDGQTNTPLAYLPREDGMTAQDLQADAEGIVRIIHEALDRKAAFLDLFRLMGGSSQEENGTGGKRPRLIRFTA